VFLIRGVRAICGVGLLVGVGLLCGFASVMVASSFSFVVFGEKPWEVGNSSSGSSLSSVWRGL
jgi:hypothetical protein